MLQLFHKYHFMIIELTIREIKARYKQSVLGYFWIILNPFFQIMIMSFVFLYILKSPAIGVPFPIFLYTGLLPWTLFVSSINSAQSSLVDGASLIKKIYFPREILVISSLLAKLFDFCLSLIAFFALLIWFQVPLSQYSLLVIPILLIQTLFTFGLSLILSVCNLFYRDVQYFFALVLTLWFYLTPVMYTVEMFPEQYRFAFRLNPMAVFINAYRQVLFTGGWPNWASLAIGAVMAIAMVVGGLWFFRKAEGTFADVL